MQDKTLHRMVLVSDEVSGQKMAMYLEIVVFSRFFLKRFWRHRFAVVSELTLKIVELNSE